MKVIGAKSLVQINPSVVESRPRVTPGVYEYDNNQPPLISCDGALNITDPIDISGDWKLEIDGVLVLPEATNIDDIVAYLNEDGFEVEISSPSNPVYVGLYVRLNPNPTVPLTGLTFYKNGVPSVNPPDSFMPYLVANNLMGLPEDNIDFGLASRFQSWDGSTNDYFFNNSPTENEYKIELLPANQNEYELNFWRNGVSLGNKVTLGPNTIDDISLLGSSYTTVGKTWSDMAVIGQSYSLSMDINKNGVVTSHSLSTIGEYETLVSVFGKIMRQVGFYKARPRVPPWHNIYEGFNIRGDLLSGNDLSYTYSQTQQSLVVNSQDRISATVTFKPSLDLPVENIDLYDLVKNESGLSVIITRGLLYAGESRIDEEV